MSLHVALRFIVLGYSEADMERSLSLQMGIQGIYGTNYQMETIGHVFFSFFAINTGRLAIQ
jgi:hypothetical protein